MLDKPAGLTVHPGAGRSTGTLAHHLLDRYPEMAGVGGPGRPGIVHRLDQGTSGVLVVARTPAAYVRLSRAFASREVRKLYLAIAYGAPSPAAGTIDAPIGRHPQERKEMAVRPGGRPAPHPLPDAGRRGRHLAPGARPRHRPDAPDPRPPEAPRPSAGGGSGLRRGALEGAPPRPAGGAARLPPPGPARLAARLPPSGDGRAPRLRGGGAGGSRGALGEGGGGRLAMGGRTTDDTDEHGLTRTTRPCLAFVRGRPCSSVSSVFFPTARAPRISTTPLKKAPSAITTRGAEMSPSRLPEGETSTRSDAVTLPHHPAADAHHRGHDRPGHHALGADRHHRVDPHLAGDLAVDQQLGGAGHRALRGGCRRRCG